MAPASSNTHSRAHHTEPLATVVEKSASSDGDSSATDIDNDSGSGENDGGNRDENDSGSDENNSGNRDENDGSSGGNDGGNRNKNDSGDTNDSEDNGENNGEDDSENNAEDNREEASENDSKNNGDDNSENNGEDNGKDNGKKDNADVPIIPTPMSWPSAIGTPVRGSEPTTATLPVRTIASVAPNPTCNWASASPVQGSMLTTAVLPPPAAFCTPVRCSMVLPTASAAPTPSREPNPGGSEIPTTASVGLALEPSIGKDSGASLTDLQPIGEGSLFLFVFLSLFIFNLVSTPPMGPLPDNGIKIQFSLTSYFKCSLDVKMKSLISLQGASRTTGGILQGNAYGNKLNHVDFEHEEALGAIMLIKPKQVFKIFIYVQYGDVLVMSWVPDFASQDPITVFLSNVISPLTQPLLQKAAQYHDFISCKHCIFMTVI